MTQDEIIRMARECGDELFGRNQRVDYEFDIHGLERFAALVAAKEREMFPNLEPVINWLESGCDPKEAAKELRIYAEAIRSRNEK